MKTIWSFLLILMFSFTGETAAQTNICPPWFFADNTSNSGCSCIGIHLEVECGSDFPLLHFGYCMTYNSSTGNTEYGACPYITRYKYSTTIVGNVLYIELPSNASILNEFMCGPLNREGPLCGKCKDGYGTALYSYTLECRKCWVHGYGWVLYWALELLPITVMYFLVVIFHIRATSSPLSALVFMSQIVVYTIRLNTPLHMYIENKITGYLHITLKVLLVLCGIWSLDFFRVVIPPFCVSSSLKTVHALTLEYLVAFYPIFLILITFICIKLHDNNFRPIVRLWKPFHRHFVHFRRRWDSKASVINAFTTFLFLAFSKILFVTFTLLYTFNIQYRNYNHHSRQKKCILYYDPTVKCHTQEHLIFAAIAVCVMVMFILTPTILLILYPTKLFRRCIACCGFRRWHALHIFVESFQGQYKDGTNGTRDFRMVSASFLILGILTMVSYLPHHKIDTWPLLEMQSALFVIATGFYAIAKPYKTSFCNHATIFVFVLLVITSLFMLNATYNSAAKAFTSSVLMSVLLLCIPHMILIFYICYRIAKKAGITQCLTKKYTTLKDYILTFKGASQSETDLQDEFDISTLPDRLVNPGEYEPLLPTKEKHTAAEATQSSELDSKDPRRLTPYMYV